MQEIELTRGYICIIDDIDQDLTNQNWIAWVHDNRPGLVYAYGYTPRPNRKTIQMHRIILSRMLNRELSPKEHCDHIDGNGLNNTRANLRLSVKHGNHKNASKKDKTTSSLYKGVHWYKAMNVWRAKIQCDNTSHHLGNFENEIDAAKAYDKAAKQLHGKFAKLNFPDEK
jgi:hypothetical protein